MEPSNLRAAERRGGPGIAAPAYVALGVITLLQVGVSLLQQGPAALGPLLVGDLHITRAELGLLTSAIWGGMLLGTLPGGLLVDRFGERVVVAIGVAAMALLVGAASLQPAFGGVFALFLASSVGAAFTSPGGTRALVAWFPRQVLGLALGFRQTGVMLGGLLGALALPPVAVALGWRPTFRIAAVFTALTLAVFVVAYREPPATRKRRPIRVRALPGNRVWLLATGFGFVFMGALGASVSYLALYLHEGAGVPVVVAGELLALLQVGGLVGRLTGGVVSDRLGRRGPVMAALGALAIAVALAFAVTGRGAPVALLGGLAFLLGLSTLGWNALAITVVSEAVPLDAAATATGASLSIAFSAMFLVSPLFGLVADRLGSYAVAWYALAGWCAVGTVLGLLIRDRVVVATPTAS